MSEIHPQDAALNKLRADNLSVLFAEDSKLDACRSYLSGQISVQSYSEVEQAHLQALRVYLIGQRASESP